jgi:hypothetical protein
MSPDDLRHGSYAGALQHRKDDEPLCDPCVEAHYKHCKAAKHRLNQGIRLRIPLGQEAWDVIDASTRTQLHRATGVNLNMLVRLHARGPDTIVLRSTQQKILSAKILFTTIGVQRRLQALAVIGYSCPSIAKIIGCHPSTLNLIRKDLPSFIRYDFAVRVVEAYDRLHMTPLDKPTTSAAARRTAAEHGWASPMAWDDIDHDDSPTVLAKDTELDEVAIERALEGDRTVKLSKAEKIAATTLWASRGLPFRELEDRTGWRVGRYAWQGDAA